MDLQTLKLIEDEINWPVVSSILGFGLFFMLLIYMRDRLQPEPHRVLLLGYLLGIASALISLQSIYMLDAYTVLNHGMVESDVLIEVAVYNFAVIGPVEEGMKFLMLWLILSRIKHFDEQIDGLVYAATIGIGFASTEAFMMIGYSSIEVPAGQIASTTLQLPFTHTLWASVWGFGMGYANFTADGSKQKILWITGTLALSMVLHSAYDFLIFSAPVAGKIAASLIPGILLLWGVHWSRKVIEQVHPKISKDTESSA